MNPVPVDDGLAAAYARDGVVCVRSVLDAGQVAAAARGIGAVLASPGPVAQVASGDKDPGACLVPRTFWLGEARWFPEGCLAELPDIDAARGAFDIRRFDLEPGDAIFFDFLTVHGAPGFPYQTRRRVLSLRYLSADARYAPRPWATSPPFEGLDAELAAGAAMDHPLFPVVWP